MCWTYISTLQTKTSSGACRKCLCWLSGLSGTCSPATSSTPTDQPQPVLNCRQLLQLLPTYGLPCSGLGTPFLARSVLCMQEGWSKKLKVVVTTLWYCYKQHKTYTDPWPHQLVTDALLAVVLQLRLMTTPFAPSEVRPSDPTWPTDPTDTDHLDADQLLTGTRP